ncbi:MAG TPA: UpxY family transcription antiterminator [Bryobacteraceae bacterium]|jgi:transcription antitermination factor NusG|nr:UpxY family transcription antiterminator [Bryobacteraceae bacterium]
MQSGASYQWYAVRTAAGREKAVSAQFQNKGFEQFLPLYRSRRQWSDRTKELELPLFPGYLFCRFDFSNRLPILVTPGVKLIVGYGKIPAPVPDAEIESLRRAVVSGAETMPWPYLSVGQKVRIREGSLAGVEGILLQVKNSWRIVLSVELLRRSVSVELDRSAVAPLFQAQDPADSAAPGRIARESAFASKVAV